MPKQRDATKNNNGKKEEVSKYKKKRVLNYLQEYGCTRDALDAIANSRRSDYNRIVDYVRNTASDAEARVAQECDSTSLANTNQWLELLKKADLAPHCQYEAATIMNAIVRNEPQPQPAELNGINMDEVYRFLENALTGQPQNLLKEASQKFLCQEIQLLINEANSEYGEQMVKEMYKVLNKFKDIDYEAHPNKCGIDPFFLDRADGNTKSE
ncbi:uncharacterized protein LOC115632921 [Scaptodrosophila lebanonensis]|uniref:Uncharacterized protein LOC115632921 n=1 Tax=Drosophila lebanonensis TaxID=7225 RepID=A0A6J2UF85_DROLE|nr:uncharacterized protein LOC115632921 [Scaptodrosophila lebanonensis]